MASYHEAIDDTHLRDIRELVHHAEIEENIVLDAQAIATYHSRAYTGFHAEAMNGLDVSITLIRHLYARISQKYRERENTDDPTLAAEIRRQEAAFPVLRLAWSDLAYSPESLHAQSEARNVVARSILAGALPRAITFAEVAESFKMHETLFAREPFQLWAKPVLSRPPRSDPDHESSWQVMDTPSPDICARESLVRWDGQQDLETTVSQKFGLFRSASHDLWYQCNKPAIIRVRFRSGNDPEPQRVARHEWEKIRNICVDTSTITINEGRIEKDPNAHVYYTITAVVRLRDERIATDLIRRYAYDGAQMRQRADWAHSSDHWKLSDANTTFMLYYANCEVHGPPTMLPELLYTPPSWEANLLASRHTASSAR